MGSAAVELTAEQLQDGGDADGGADGGEVDGRLRSDSGLTLRISDSGLTRALRLGLAESLPLLASAVELAIAGVVDFLLHAIVMSDFISSLSSPYKNSLIC